MRFCAVLLFILVSAVTAVAVEDEPTNVEINLVDHQGFVELGCNEKPFPNTPLFRQVRKPGSEFAQFSCGEFDWHSFLQSPDEKSRISSANFAYVELVEAALNDRPRVLIIGDSISLGYTPVLQGMFYKQIDIVRPPNKNGGWINCQGTKLGAEMIDEWLADGDYDVIHFNFGLHDLKHVHPETGRNSNDPSHPQQSNLKEYEKNLRAIVAKLKTTKAKLIFATTTPYPDKPGGPLRRADQPAKYNEVALSIMKENGVRVNDLHGFVHPRMEKLLLPNNVHFRPSANLELAEQVAKEIKKALK